MMPSLYESTGKGKYPFDVPLLVKTDPVEYIDSVCPNCKMQGRFIKYTDPRLTARNVYILCGSCNKVFRVWDWREIKWKYLTYTAHEWESLERGR